MGVPGGRAGKAAALCGAAVVAYFCALVVLSLTSLDVTNRNHALLMALVMLAPLPALAGSLSIWRWSRLVADDLASRDDLTGLRNRRAFTTSSELVLKGASPGKIALVLFDVNGLKQLNDGCGHQTGDELLRLAARQLQGAAAGGASVYRIGGDEFAILLLRSKGGQLAAMLRCLKPFEAPFPDCAHQHMVRMSFGYASCEEGEGFESLFRRADLRLRESKDKLYGLRRIPEGDMHPEGEGDERLPRPERGLALIHSARG